MSSRSRSLWEEERGADLRILFDNGDVPGHSVLLARASLVWKQRFFGPVHVCEKEKCVVDMKGHDRLFMQLVYECPPRDLDDMDWSILMDVVELAHRYDVPHVVDYMRQVIASKSFTATHSEVEFAEAWPYWDQPFICASYARMLEEIVTRMIRKEDKLPPEVQWYIVNNDTYLLGEGYMGFILDILVDLWRKEEREEHKAYLLLSLEKMNIEKRSLFLETEEKLVKAIRDNESDAFFCKLERKMLERVAREHPLRPIVQMVCDRYTVGKRKRNDEDK